MAYTKVVTVNGVASDPADGATVTESKDMKSTLPKYTQAERVGYTVFTALTYIIPLFVMVERVAVRAPAPHQLFFVFFNGIVLIGINMSVCLHRYFTHNAFETTRAFQFVLAVMGCLAFQNGPLWWASKHNRHHKYCDLPEDPHSVTQAGFFYAFVGWTMDIDESHVDERFVAAQFKNKPELEFLNKYWYLPAMVLNFALYCTLGYTWMGCLYTVPMILCRLITLLFNVEYHPLQDPKKCKAVDNSRWLAVIVGEADHLDHHKYPTRAQRPGWDLPYYVFMKPCEALGLIWYRKK